jgi:hypothetical protein
VILLPFYSFFPLAVAVALVSYPHAVVAVRRWNQRIEETERSLKPLLPPPSTFQPQLHPKASGEILTRSCSGCGVEVSSAAEYCRICGKKLDEMPRLTPSVQSMRSCPRCGVNVSQAAKHCRICGQPLDQTRIW